MRQPLYPRYQNDGAPVILNKNDNSEITAAFSFTTGIPDSKAVGIFFKDELESHVAAYPMIQNANEIPAGDYSGTAIFNVKLTAKE
ncbi:hypothetical protein IJ556_03325 [bacterium]|nr:hypothetical protein [bacterium]